MTEMQIQQLSEENQKELGEMLAKFFQNSLPPEIFPAIEIEIKLDLSKLEFSEDQKHSLLIEEQKISPLEPTQVVRLFGCGCAACSPGQAPNGPCQPWNLCWKCQ